MLEPLSRLLCFILPVSTALFLATGPHGWEAALAWTLPLWGLVLADWLSPKAGLQPDPKLPNGYYDAILYALALLQFLNIGLMLDFVARLHWDSAAAVAGGIANLVALRILVGTSSGSSGIIVAHELIHRPQPSLQWLGRLLLCTVCYEHFAVAHRQGHHRDVGKPNDITGARRGESFASYWRRVYVEHFHFAWRFEKERLRMPQRSFRLSALLENRVLQGLAVEMVLVASAAALFGWLAALAFLYQSFAAVRLLETINYHQHWGIEDETGKTLAWVNPSWLSGRVLLGLTHHIDHHEHPGRPYHRIRYAERGPKMPYGYFVMNLWVKLDNASYRKRAEEELEKYEKRLAA
ncbi:MAG: fatty acid desaturase [Gammaproteobacteria bacterium]